jgi:hypothetical protein
MVKEHVLIKGTKFVLSEFLFDLIYWVIWWYTLGVKKAFIRLIDIVKQGNEQLGVLVWIKNLFKPMFGQNDWQGRLISFFVRLIQIVLRILALCFWLLYGVVSFLFWLALPVIIVFEIALNLGFFGNIWQ